MDLSSASIHAIILAGGAGTRLRASVGEIQKCILEINGRPFLEWVLLWLKNQGIQDVTIATGYQAESVEKTLGNGERFDLKIEYSRETSPLGTGGAIRKAFEGCQSDFALVLNGDSFCAFNLAQLRDEHVSSSALASLWLVQVHDTSRFGRVEKDASGWIQLFSEKCPNQGGGNINAGIYLLNRELINTISSEKMVSLEREIFPHLASTKRLFGVSSEELFIDIGTPEAYGSAKEFFKTDRFRLLSS